jgi:hypothetical protein
MKSVVANLASVTRTGSPKGGPLSDPIRRGTPGHGGSP